ASHPSQAPAQAHRPAGRNGNARTILDAERRVHAARLGLTQVIRRAPNLDGCDPGFRDAADARKRDGADATLPAGSADRGDSCGIQTRAEQAVKSIFAAVPRPT